MVSYVMERRKGRRSLVVLFVAFVVATVGVYLLAMSTTAKPAQAATTCAPYAVKPTQPSIGAQIRYQGGISCTGGQVRKASVTVQLQRQNANGGWSVVDSFFATSPPGQNTSGVGGIDFFPCTGPYTPATYRTAAVNGKTVALNGTPKTYTPRYSVKMTARC